MTTTSLAPLPVDFLCIGAQKACTTWLSRILKSDRNNKIFIPYIKESFYLNILEGANDIYPTPDRTITKYAYSSFRALTEREIRAAASKGWGTDGMTQKQAEYLRYLCESLTYYWKGLDSAWYEHLFSAAEANQLRGDLTPDYSFLGMEMIASLCQAKPDLKIILLTRNPILRDLSQLRMQLLPRHPNPSDEKCIQFLVQPHVRERSRYWEIMQRWTNAFGTASVMSIDAELITANPRLAARKISSFLEAELDISDEVLMSRENVSTSDWKPSPKIIEFLKNYYQNHDVYGELAGQL